MVKMERRPTTATLKSPSLLDTRLLGIFDMTTVSREHLLAIKNLVHSTPRCKCKSTNKTLTMDCQSLTVESNKTEIEDVYKTINKTYRIRRHNGRPKIHKEEPLQNDLTPKIPVIPTPCVTCRREDQPERFHSHPSRSDVKKNEIKHAKEATEDRKTVQKPVPIKFRSAKAKPAEVKEVARNDKQVSPTHHKLKEEKSPKRVNNGIVSEKTADSTKENAKIKTRWKETVHKTQANKADASPSIGTIFSRTPSYEAYKLDTWVPAPVSGGRKRKVVCYLCSKEFGTATLPSHEAQCMRKYLTEGNTEGKNVKDSDIVEKFNDRPSSQARENWKLAWELTQTSLIPCHHCGRKFLPNRVDAHQKVCSLKSDKRHRLKITVKEKNKVSQAKIKCEPCDKWFTGLIISQRNDTTDKSNQSSLEKKPLNVIPADVSNTDSTITSSTSDNIKELNESETNPQESFWKAHQAQLVPCAKCGRRFYPHRVDVHVKGCKGSTKFKKKSSKTVICDRVVKFKKAGQCEDKY